MITQIRDSCDSVLADLVDEITRQMQVGQPVDVDALTREQPELADRLRELLPTLQLLNQLKQQSPASGAGPASHGKWPSEPSNGAIADGLMDRSLGDFRIVREIGRGGMGVVYEAEQISLGRTVALKVLPFAAMLDQRQLTRFRNEARAAAALHHHNIVPVFSVGCERGVHYYAMQFIGGESLAAIIADIARQESGVKGQDSEHDPTTSFSPRRVAGGNSPDLSPVHPITPAPVHEPGATDSASAADDTAPKIHGLLSTARSTSDRAYFRTIAELGIQAAEALDHAHEQGVIHRDIKPANLMLDETGRLWITDFGLARLEADAGMTMTGDLIGTLRYMSPEQALAKRVVVDHRTDIYSLGVTLFELLALRPAFDGEDRQQLLKQIAFEDPPLLRKLNRQIPAELETIVEKSIRKNPEERYACCRDLADDLRNFLANKPIKAKPPTWREHLLKYSRRHPAGVRATALALATILIAIAAMLGWAARDRAARLAVVNQQINQALKETEALHQAGKLTEAMSAVKHAGGLLVSGASDELKQRVEKWHDDLEMVERLEQIRFDQALPPIKLKETSAEKQQKAISDTDENKEFENRVYDIEGAKRKYQTEFRRYEFDLESLDVEQASQQIRLSPIKQELIAALDDWIQNSSGAEQTKLLQVARLVDPDLLRGQLREAIQHDDKTALVNLAAEKEIAMQPPTTVLMLARALGRQKEYPLASEILRHAQRQHPTDFWINTDLATSLSNVHSSSEEALGYQRVAQALRPNSPAAYNGVGQILYAQRNYEDAEAEFRTAIRLKSDYWLLHDNLGAVLSRQGQQAEAEVEFREAVRLEPENSLAHYLLSEFYNACHKYAEAEVALREAIRLEPQNNSAMRAELVAVLENQGKHTEGRIEATAAVQEAKRTKPDRAQTYHDLGQAFYENYNYKEAEDALHEAVRLEPENVSSLNLLAILLDISGKNDQAEAIFRKLVGIKPDNAVYRSNLAFALSRQKKYDEAEATFGEAIRLQPNRWHPHQYLGDALMAQEKCAEAEAAYREAVRLDPKEPNSHSALATSVAKQAAGTTNSPRWDEAAAEFALAIDLSIDGSSHAATRKQVCQGLAQWDEVFDRVVKLRPDEPTLWIGKGQYQIRFNRWAEAQTCYAKVMQSRPVSTECDEYAALLLIVGDTQGYQRFCRELASRPGEPHDGYAATNMARAGLARPEAVDAEQVVRWAAQGVDEANQDTFRKHVLGLAQYRAGEYEVAIHTIEDAMKERPWWGDHQNWFVLAMAHHHLGHAEEAQTCLEAARELIAKRQPKKADEPVGGAPVDWVCMQVLLREAETLLQEPTPEPKTATIEQESKQNNQ